MRQIGVAGWTGLFDELLDGKSSSKVCGGRLDSLAGTAHPRFDAMRGIARIVAELP